MKPYIFISKLGIHIIDLKKTQVCIEKACEAINKISACGEQVLFVGTKKQAKNIIKSEADRCDSPFVTERWLGGMLTNFATIRRSLKTLQALEKKSVDGTYDLISKKERLSIEKERGKLERVLGGIRDMKKLPGAIFVIDTRKEAIAVAEARKLNIPVFAIIDTNVDPDLVDYPVPANDDAFKSIGLVTRLLTDAIMEGSKKAQEMKQEQVSTAAPAKSQQRPPRRRSRRGPRKPPRENRDKRNSNVKSSADKKITSKTKK